MFEPGIESFFRDSHTQVTRVAVVTNFTGRNRNGEHLVNLLAQHSSFELVRIFTPEHGFSSDAPDGEPVADSSHPELSIPVVSLYGDHKIPSKDHLNDLDAVIYDIQDVGVRFYTYISTLRNILDAADGCNLPVWILDRPDVLGGIEVEGPMLLDGFSSFVGHLPIPVRYGMTPAELALWWKAKAGLSVEIKIWKCVDYACSSQGNYPDFPWYKPSPSMPDVATAQFYPGTCLFEGTQLSEGRGTDAPFRNIGAPWIDPHLWANKIRTALPDEIEVEVSHFVPTFSKYEGKKCNGIRFSTGKAFVKDAVYLGVLALHSLMATHNNMVEFEGRPSLEKPFIDYLCGTDGIRKGLLSGEEPQNIMSKNNSGVSEFLQERQNCLLYPRK